MDDYFTVELVGVDGEWHPLYNRFCGIATFVTEDAAKVEATAVAKETGRVARVVRFTHSVVFVTDEETQVGKKTLADLDQQLFG